jgi:hypothetical protein
MGRGFLNSFEKPSLLEADDGGRFFEPGIAFSCELC